MRGQNMPSAASATRGKNQAAMRLVQTMVATTSSTASIRKRDDTRCCIRGELVQQVPAPRRPCKRSQKSQNWPPDHHGRTNGPVKLERSIYLVNNLNII